MKIYKLIKEYPNSPIPLGHKIETKENLDKYPEFWEEVVNRNYEILTVTPSELNVAYKPLQEVRPYEGGFNDHWQIHSVIRLSDGEVFTVGDELQGVGKILSFTVYNLASGGMHLDIKSGQIAISACVKQKKPLFTTEDGADLFEGDKYYYPTHLYTISSEILPIENKISAESWDNLMRYSQNNNPKFSTKEAAEEYILMNEPHFSINDVSEVYESIAPSGSPLHKNLINALKGRV